MRSSSKPDDPHDAQACRVKALDLLARREHGCLELTAKLESRGFAADCVTGVVAQLGADGLQDDARFADTLVRVRISRCQGPLRIRSELRSRGISDEVAAAALQHGNQNWGELASQARAKRFGFSGPADFKDKARQQRFLQSRGFSADHIKAALDLAADSD